MAKKQRKVIKEAEEEIVPVKKRIVPTKNLIEEVKKELVGLTGFKFPAATGFRQEGGELVVTVEMVEKESIPNGMDVLGTYEVRVDEGGKIIGYERTGLRKRSDTAFAREE